VVGACCATHKRDGTLLERVYTPPVYDNGKQLSFNHIEVQNDITERKWVEEEVRESPEGTAQAR